MKNSPVGINWTSDVNAGKKHGGERRNCKMITFMYKVLISAGRDDIFLNALAWNFQTSNRSGSDWQIQIKRGLANSAGMCTVIEKKLWY